MNRTSSTALLSIALILTAGCAGGPPKADATASSAVVPPVGPSHNVVSPRYVTVFSSVEEFVKLPEMVAVVTVTAEKEHAGRKSEEVTVSRRMLTMKVEEALAGQVPPTLEVVDFGSVATNSGHRPQVAHDGIRLQVGDRAIVAVNRFGGELWLVNNQAAYLLADGEVKDTDRKDPVIREIERLSETEVKERVRRGRN